MKIPVHSDYRPEIDGMRAIAVILVIGFHLFSDYFPSGFIGVDMFFVISGYLIGGILIKESKSGSICLLNFYCRRAVRILPALLVVLLATWASGWYLFFAAEYAELGKDIVASGLFANNLRAWTNSGYFVRESEMQPLLHLWSLGVEEQFYLFIPVLIAFLTRTGAFLAKGLIFVTIASFFLSCYSSLYHPSAAFYWPMTRAWELLIGTCVVVLGARQSNSRNDPDRQWLAKLSAPFGLLLIGLAIIYIKPGPGYPGLWAVLPVLGTALLIHSGRASWINRRILANRTLRYVGLISYPWYLWHWPIWLAWKVGSGRTPDLWDGFLVAALSFVLAALTMHLVERPVRYSQKPMKTRAFVLASGLSLVLGLGLLTAQRIPEERLASLSNFANARDAVEEKFDYPFKDNFGKTSHFTIDGEEPNAGEPVVLFAGDSHMQHYWPRIRQASETMGSDRMKWRFVTAGGHPMLPDVNRMEPGYDCDAFFRFILAEAKRPEVKRVVLSCAWQLYFLGPFPSEDGDETEIGKLKRLGNSESGWIKVDDLQPVLARFEENLRELHTLGKDVVVILPSVRSSRWNPKEVARWHSGLLLSPEYMSVSQEKYGDFISPLRDVLQEAALRGRAKTIDPCDYLVENGRFSGLEPDARFRYRDKHHFRSFYVQKFARFIDELMQLPSE
jgi:peptidoglycan/LPS O-acetylase OafA/YrhL